VAAVLLVLLAAEGVTVLRVRALLTAHVLIGVLLVPPVLLKIGTTGYRFVRYYTGSPAYRRKGPPALLLRVLGPLVVVLTTCLFASGIALLFAGPGLRRDLLLLHKASFVLWFVVMAVHVLGHLLDNLRSVFERGLKEERYVVDAVANGDEALGYLRRTSTPSASGLANARLSAPGGALHSRNKVGGLRRRLRHAHHGAPNRAPGMAKTSGGPRPARSLAPPGSTVGTGAHH
jgi:hypothetical protein